MTQIIRYFWANNRYYQKTLYIRVAYLSHVGHKMILHVQQGEGEGVVKYSPSVHTCI